MLSKSKYMTGLWCPKLLWYMFNDKERIPPSSAESEANMAEGTVVGELARKLFPDGILIDGDFSTLVPQTQEALPQNKPIFEASFQHNGAYCKVDILVPDGDGWELIEVKKSCSVKPEHIEDVAFQTWTLQEAGLKITSMKLLRLNREYIRQGEIDIQQLFIADDITEAVTQKLSEVPDNVKRLLAIIDGPRPEHEVVHSCNNPYECQAAHIDVGPAPEHNLSQLYWAKKKGAELIQQGVITFEQIPDDFKLNAKQKIQRDAVINEQSFMNKEKLQEFLQRLEYPLFYFDFETIGGAVPPLDGMCPYDATPFQFSLHIQREPDGDLEHIEFLGEELDSREKLVEAMKSLETKGSIIAYNSGFEMGCINSLAKMFPDEQWLLDLLPRFWDLMEPFKQFWYYHPEQKGSYSIKYVLPALTDISYADLDINRGDFASREFVRVMTQDVPEQERQSVRHHLLEYCKLDTLAMVEVLRVLQDEVQK